MCATQTQLTLLKQLTEEAGRNADLSCTMVRLADPPALFLVGYNLSLTTKVGWTSIVYWGEQLSKLHNEHNHAEYRIRTGKHFNTERISGISTSAVDMNSGEKTQTYALTNICFWLCIFLPCRFWGSQALEEPPDFSSVGNQTLVVECGLGKYFYLFFWNTFLC